LGPVAEVSGALAGGFRLRARLAIRGRVGSPKIGLFELDSHRVVHIPNCRVHHPLINQVAGVVRRALVETRLTSYSEHAGLGLARYLQVVIERSSQAAQVVVVGNSPTLEPLERCFEIVRERLGETLHSLWFNSNREQGNSILGSDFVHWHGPKSVIECFGGAAVHYPPGAFGQSNLEIAEQIIGHLRDRIPRGSTVAEFYAGVGAIGLSVLEKAASLRLNEVNPHSLEGLESGLCGLDAATRAKIEVIPGEAGAALEAARDTDVVIVDPPRKGLAPLLTDFLSQTPPRHLFYVSCGVDSLLRDCARLTSAGKQRLASLTAFNLLPFTEHVEAVACFERC
jgi:tRNA/tmRNA/rRNA uracil-C5-methylase (TrmA/RlmC/RlmD family)